MPDAFVCRAVTDNCYATMWSYGEICVGCGCCGEPSWARDTARLGYWRQLLTDDEQFSGWSDDPDVRQTQETNVIRNTEDAKKQIADYTRLCDLHQEINRLGLVVAERDMIIAALKSGKP